ncbi:MAG: tetratricopeptide repeat protein [Planctomycetaceae bacterium]
MKFQRRLMGTLVCLGLAGCHSSASQFGMGRNMSKSTEVDEQVAGNREADGSADAPAPLEQPSSPASQKPASVLLQEGQLALRSGDLNQAEERFQEILKNDPLNATAHHRLAVIADNRKDYRTAEKHYLVALQGNPHDANLLSDMGYSYMLQGNTENAKRFLSDALDKNPEHPQAANNLGAIYAEEGNSQQALEMFRRSGTEQEAQAKLAYVMNQNTSSTFASSPKNEAETPSRGSPLAVDPEFSAAQNGSASGLQTSDEHRRIVEQMRQAREADQLKRRREEELLAASQATLPVREGFDANPRYNAPQEFPGSSYVDVDPYAAADIEANAAYPPARNRNEQPPMEYDDTYGTEDASYGSRDGEFNREVDDGRERYASSPNDAFGVQITPNTGNRPSSAGLSGAAPGEMDPNAAWPPEDISLETGADDRRSNPSRSQPQGPRETGANGNRDSYAAADEVIYAGGETASRDPYVVRNQDHLPQFDEYRESDMEEGATTGFANPSTSNPRQYAAQNVHAGTDESSRQAAMLAGLNAGPSQLFPVQSGMTSLSSEYGEFPATQTRLGSQFSPPARSMPGEAEMQNWPAPSRNSHQTHRQTTPSQPQTRMGYEFSQPGRTTSARYPNLNEESLDEPLPSAWDDPSPSLRALQEQSQYSRH